VAVALVIATVVVQLASEVSDRQKDLLPASAWLVVNEVYVPDFEEGKPPMVLYDREIHENFDAFWIVEVQRKTVGGLWSSVCSGNGVNEYDPAEVIPNNTVSWDWYINAKCEVPPGTYRLKTTYTMTRPGWPQKRVFNTSNEFKVTAQGVASALQPGSRQCGQGKCGSNRRGPFGPGRPSSLLP
jgi:hypothetical protein